MAAIEDGYNFTRTLPAAPFVDGRVEITFRPAAGAAHRAFSRSLMGGVPESTAMGASIIAGSVKEWSLRRSKDGKLTMDAADPMIPVTAEEAAKLPSGLFTEILDTVFGFANTEEGAAALKN